MRQMSGIDRPATEIFGEAIGKNIQIVIVKDAGLIGDKQVNMTKIHWGGKREFAAQFLLVKTMPRVISSFRHGEYWFFYTVYGGKVREIYVPQQDQNRTIEIPLPRPISVDELETWVRRNHGRFLYEAIRAYDGRNRIPDRFTLEPLCRTCGQVVERLNTCSVIREKLTCNACRQAACLDCSHVDCAHWVNVHPEHAEILARNEDPLEW